MQCTNPALNRTVSATTYRWYSTQTGGASTNAVEVFAASWVRDLMVARNYADERFLAELATDGSRMSGTTDANFGFTPGTNQTHDIGMAMDLSLNDYLKKDPYQNVNDGEDLSAAIATADKKYTDVSAALAKAWSNDKAFDLAELLKTLKEGEGKNKQTAALKEFFLLYSVTQSKNGPLGEAAKAFVNAADKDKAASALFEGTILKGYVGQVGKNEYKAINDILNRLGVDYRPEVPHADHFHITFTPPKIQGTIEAPELLLADATNAGAQSYAVRMGASGFESAYGDVQLVQVAQNLSPTYGKTIVLDACHRAERGVWKFSPLSDLNAYLQRAKQPVPEYITDASVTVTRQPSFGKLSPKISGYGENEFDYVASDKNWLGRDRVEFEVTYQGKIYKIINRIEMVRDAEASDDMSKKSYDGPCDSKARRIAYEVSGKVASDGTNTLGLAWDDVDAMLANLGNQPDLSNAMLVFGDLPGAAVGNTEEQVTNATITLDTNAAGHGWYIGTTPATAGAFDPFNTDDYLPTSSPNVWQAQAGSAAKGKIDL